MKIVLDTNCLVNVIMPGSYNNDAGSGKVAIFAGDEQKKRETETAEGDAEQATRGRKSVNKELDEQRKGFVRLSMS